MKPMTTTLIFSFSDNISAFECYNETKKFLIKEKSCVILLFFGLRS